MAWTTPITFVASQMVTAAHLNAMRDNFLETAPAKATAAARIFVTTGPNAIAERQILDSVVETPESTSSTSFTSLTTDGPTVTVTTGPRALVWVNAQLSNSATSTSACTFEITGATSTAASDARALIFSSGVAGQASRGGVCTLMVTTAGSNTFHMLYRTANGATTSSFEKRRLQVMAL